MEELMTTQGRQHGWRKSSFSDTGNGCVEVARTLAAIRDSKNPEGPRLSADVRGLVAAVRDGQLS
jgi:hypothetical protein